MKKKLVLTGLALTLTLALAACSDKEEKKPVDETKVEVKNQEDSKKKVSLTEAQLEKLVFTSNVYLTDGVLKVDATLDNRTEEQLPVAFESKKAVVITILDEDGKEIDKKEFDEDKRDKINTKESLFWKHERNLNDSYGEYEVNVALNLLDAKGNVIEGYEETTSIQYEKEVTYTYMPNKATKLVYEMNDGSGTDAVEEYLYFEDGYAQSYNTSVGGNVIYYSDDNGYYRVYSEVSQKKENKIKDIAPIKELLLKLPVSEGAEWDIEGIKHKLVEDNITITTKYGKLTNVSIVEVNIGQIMRLYYHEDFGMVKTEVKTPDGDYETVMELKAVQ